MELAQKGKTPQRFFAATFKKELIDKPKSNAKLKEKNDWKLCLCGKQHLYKYCWYLIKSI